MRVAESENIIIDGCPHHRSALLESGHGRRHALTPNALRAAFGSKEAPSSARHGRRTPYSTPREDLKYIAAPAPAGLLSARGRSARRRAARAAAAGARAGAARRARWTFLGAQASGCQEPGASHCLMCSHTRELRTYYVLHSRMYNI